MKYFDIHVHFGERDGDGYSIPVAAENETAAKEKAISESLFECDDDVYCIDNISEISEEEYFRMTSI